MTFRRLLIKLGTLAGTIDRTECTFALMFLPAVVLGIAGSGFLYKKIQAHHFCPLTFMLVIIAGMLAIIAGIKGIDLVEFLLVTA